MGKSFGLRGIVALGGLLLSLLAGSTAATAEVHAALPLAQGLGMAAQMAAANVTLATPQDTAVDPGVGSRFNRAVRMAIESLPPVMDPGVGPPTAIGPVGDLGLLVAANSDGVLDRETQCLANAVYFESRGEPLVGQLAVAQVVINRTRSGRYPPTICGVVKQAAQFSFVRRGVFPHVQTAGEAWRTAQAIARIATRALAVEIPGDVLWYHADYVAPRWRQSLVQFQKIGTHIFYRT